jgi:hypothetical protein
MESAQAGLAQRLTYCLVKRLASVLLPLGVSFEQFVAAAKTGFVEAAAENISRRDGRVSQAKISVLTGLPRAEVARLRVRSHQNVQPAVPKQRAERVMHGWYTDSTFLDDTGRPINLTHPGSFRGLVRKYSGDIPTRALLDELLDAGMVTLEPGGIVRAFSRHYRTDGNTDDLKNLEFDVEAFLAIDSPTDFPPMQSRSRLSADFLGESVPPAVLRNVSIRTERFLGALSEYLQNAARQIEGGRRDGHEAITTLNVLLSRFAVSRRVVRARGRP